MGKIKEEDVEILDGWRLQLFNKMLKDGMIKIKNKQLIVTDKFMKIINKKLKEIK